MACAPSPMYLPHSATLRCDPLRPCLVVVGVGATQSTHRPEDPVVAHHLPARLNGVKVCLEPPPKPDAGTRAGDTNINRVEQANRYIVCASSFQAIRKGSVGQLTICAMMTRRTATESRKSGAADELHRSAHRPAAREPGREGHQRHPGIAVRSVSCAEGAARRTVVLALRVTLALPCTMTWRICSVSCATCVTLSFSRNPTAYLLANCAGTESVVVPSADPSPGGAHFRTPSRKNPDLGATLATPGPTVLGANESAPRERQRPHPASERFYPSPHALVDNWLSEHDHRPLVGVCQNLRTRTTTRRGYQVGGGTRLSSTQCCRSMSRTRKTQGGRKRGD